MPPRQGPAVSVSRLDQIATKPSSELLAPTSSWSEERPAWRAAWGEQSASPSTGGRDGWTTRTRLDDVPTSTSALGRETPSPSANVTKTPLSSVDNLTAKSPISVKGGAWRILDGMVGRRPSVRARNTVGSSSWVWSTTQSSARAKNTASPSAYVTEDFRFSSRLMGTWPSNNASTTPSLTPYAKKMPLLSTGDWTSTPPSAQATDTPLSFITNLMPTWPSDQSSRMSWSSTNDLMPTETDFEGWMPTATSVYSEPTGWTTDKEVMPMWALEPNP